jgi:hypothetical protein
VAQAVRAVAEDLNGIAGTLAAAADPSARFLERTHNDVADVRKRLAELERQCGHLARFANVDQR